MTTRPGAGGPIDGRADERLRRVLDGFAAGVCGEYDVSCALADSWLLVPVVTIEPDEDGASLEDHAGDERSCGAGHAAQTALPSLIGSDGRRAALAFTSLEALSAWRADARPLPVATGQACSDAVANGASALVLDVAGPVRHVIEGARLAALAAGEPVPEPHRDPDVLRAVHLATRGEPDVRRVAVLPGAEADLRIRLETGGGPHPELARRVAGALNDALPGRLPRGIEFELTNAPG